MPASSTSALRFATGAWSPSLAHSLAVAGSVALHAGLLWLGTGSQGGGHTPSLAPPHAAIDISLEADGPNALSTPLPSPTVEARAPVTHVPRPTVTPHTRAVPSPASAHPPGNSPAGSADAPAPLAGTAPGTGIAAPPRFTLLAATSARSSDNGPGPQATVPGGGSASAVVWDAHDVSEPARLVATTPAVYPSSATAAGLETDVALELVVDESGHVAGARARGHAGYGFDRAALDAVRGYRFSPARRDGRPVRVRLNFTVHFRLS